MAADNPTPPILQGPGAKERKYDRQLRLWAAQGQEALEAAHILLINSGPGVVGVETLKNLILPGIGQFTILDPERVTEADLGVNFFLTEEGLDKPRAESTCRLLNELNPDVKGHAISEVRQSMSLRFLTNGYQSVESFFSRPDVLSPFSLILAVLPLPSSTLDAVSSHVSKTNIPAFYIHSVGFYGSFTVQLPAAFPIVDTHPDPATTTDLRLLEAWPALQEYAEQQTERLQQMDDDDHGHVPYLLLLLHYLQKWRAEHDGQPPTTYKEKTSFRDLVRSGSRTSSSGDPDENYEEAASAVLKTINPSIPSSSVKGIFSASECQNLTHDSPSFWLIANAIHTFYTIHSVLPLPGGLPDMKAKSADYITLQQIYKSKARADVVEVTKTVRGLEASLKVSTPTPQVEIDAFCKSAGYIKLLRGRPPQVVSISASRPYVSWGDRATWVAGQLSDKESLMYLYISMLAYDAYLASRGDKEARYDAEAVTLIANAIIEDLGVQMDEETQEVTDNYVAEIVRAQGGELHNTSSLLGGMVAQEVIKAVTGQYVPIDNVCVWDGVGSQTAVFRL